jgi:lipoprotein-anchoring transpeptidase ErfK/SrfK
MMHKLLAALFFVLLTFSIAPVQAYAAVNAAQDEALLIQKKKKLAEVKAAEEKKKAVRAADVAKLKAARQKAAMLRAERRKTMRTAARRDCGTFMQCLFGKSRRTDSAGGVSKRSMRKQVAWNETKYAPGTVIVRTPERALYYVMGDGEAMRYSIGVGREGFQWSGNSRIVAKAEWPDWRPPQTMIEREAAKGVILREGRARQSAGRPRHVYWRHDLSRPRHQCRILHRRGRLIGLHPHDECRRD